MMSSLPLRPAFRMLLLVAVCACSYTVSAQRNVFHFDAPQSLLQASELAYIYTIPTDSVEQVVFYNRRINPAEAWLQHPAYIVPRGKADSLLALKNIPAGYYLTVGAFRNHMEMSIHHCAGFNVSITDLSEVMVLLITDSAGRELRDVAVSCAGRGVTYDTAMHGYVLRHFKSRDVVKVQRGGDAQFFRCAVQENENYKKPKLRNETIERAAAAHIYNGYLVTNKPKYLPHDTVKWKAYIEQPFDRNRPVREALRVTFMEQQYGGKAYHIADAFEPGEPGVYFGEFVLGDSVDVDKDYRLELYGTRTSFRITQGFKVEDYLLDETHLRITGEGLEQYQPGDSVKMFAAAYTSNGLPVLDGQLSITIMPRQYHTRVLKPAFIADTLYHTVIPVNPDGETLLGFSTKGFPEPLEELVCKVSLVNAAFEHRDTSFSIAYTTAKHYVRVAQQGGVALASLISNKGTTGGSGRLIAYRRGGFSEERRIIFPYEYRISAGDESVTFQSLNSSGEVVSARTLYIPDAQLSGTDDFVGDTAILRLSNPQRLRYRYSIYSGSRFLSYGFSDADTTIKVLSKKGRTVTVIGAYTWRGIGRQQRFDIYRMDRELNIDLRKKDLIYPGQRDTISIRLSNKDGKGVTNTNVTVLAFNSQFAEDNTPVLPYGGLQYPGYTSHRTRSIEAMYLQQPENIFATRAWLEKCAADTIFFYRNLYLLPDDVAWLSYDVPESVMPQVGIYLQKEHNYYQPEIIYVDSRPAYVKRAAGIASSGFFVSEGVHNIRFRTATAEYRMDTFYVCAGTKTDFYLNTDSVGPFYYKVTGQRHEVKTFLRDNHLRTLISKMPLHDSLEYYEKDALAGSLLLYRSEYQGNYHGGEWLRYGVPQFFQYPLQVVGEAAYNRMYGSEGNSFFAGPFDFRDSVGFYQSANTRLRFMPERGQVFSFRPGMTRVEKADAYAYLRYRLTDEILWPASDYVAPNPRSFDSLQVMPEMRIPEGPTIYRKARERNVSVVHSLTERTPVYKDTAATAKLRIVSADSAFRYVAIHRIKDSAQPVVVNGYFTYPMSLRPARYAVAVVWRDYHFSLYDTVQLRASGTTVFPVSYAGRQGMLSSKSAPAWLAASLEYDSTDKAFSAYYSHIYSGGGTGIQGTIRDHNGDPVPAVSIIVSQGGMNRIVTGTDIDGRYEAKPLVPGKYDVTIASQGEKTIITGVDVIANALTKLDYRCTGRGKELGAVTVRRQSYMKPLLSPDGMRNSRTGDEIDRLSVQSTSSVVSLGPNVYSNGRGSGMSIGGGRSSGNNIIVDGVQYSGGQLGTTSLPPGAESYRSGIPARYGDASGGVANISAAGLLDRSSSRAQTFFNAFLGNMMQATGLRKDFRDWAIWEPNLRTNSEGTTSFPVTYPSNTTSWKTYVLAMNRDGYAGKIVRLTRAFKPLSAQLLAPRFLRYGDTAEGIGKVANYTEKPFYLRTSFMQAGKTIAGDTATVNNTHVTGLHIAAPLTNGTDTAQLPVSYSITAENGYTDGEEKIIPVLPVGVIQSSGLFEYLDRDTTLYSAPDSTAGHFSGKARVYVDGSMLGVMLHEIERLREYPHGCNEQLTTKLLAIYYEEAIKKLLGRSDFNNTATKKKILEQLVRAQRPDGGFGWWSSGGGDYRITNYIISTMQKINSDGWLSVIIRRGLGYLNDHLEDMSQHDRIASLVTLSIAGYAANYCPMLAKVDSAQLSHYDRFAILKICKEQSLPYRAGLDTMMKLRHQAMNGTYWSNKGHYYDWYRDDLATTLLAYSLVKGDSIYGKLAPGISRYLLFRREGGYYRSTASAGLVLTTILPDLLTQKLPANGKVSTSLRISGSVNDSLTTFPKMYAVNEKHPHFSFRKSGISPVYVSVVYDYFNAAPAAHDSDFAVRTCFLNAARDTVTSLKAGEKITLRTTVTCRKSSEYIMIEVPVPAGCITVDKSNGQYRYPESARENFRDQTDIFCDRLSEGTYTFDITLEARFKGSYSLSPARAGMMYYPEEYGNTAVKRVLIK